MVVTTSTKTRTHNVRDVVTMISNHSFIFATLALYISFVINFLKTALNWTNTRHGSNKGTSKVRQNDDLFPKSMKVDAGEPRGMKECSTELGTKLIPVKNESGEIEWRFVQDETKPYYYNSAQSQQPQQQQQFSPLSEASSANDSHIETKLKTLRQDVSSKKVQLASPAPSTANDLSPPLYAQIQQQQAKSGLVDLSPQSSNKSQSSLDSKLSEDDDSLDEDEEEEEELDPLTGKMRIKSHQCPHCSAKFRVRGYLTRHIKKHSTAKAYKCPFFNASAVHKCHATGGFSRRDTYKTHLKSRHFKYPAGTKSAKRTGMVGWCGLCGQSFANNEIWVEKHIESGECLGLPDTYQKRDFSKKKTGKRSHLLDAVLTVTPPPLSVKSTQSIATTSNNSNCSTPYSSTSPSLSGGAMTTKYQSPSLAPYSPMYQSKVVSQQQQQQQQPAQAPQQKQQQDASFDAFYYQPTNFQPVAKDDEDFAPLDDEFYNIKNTNPMPSSFQDNTAANIAALNFLLEQQKRGQLNQPIADFNYGQAFDKLKNQFPDFGF